MGTSFGRPEKNSANVQGLLGHSDGIPMPSHSPLPIVQAGSAQRNEVTPWDGQSQANGAAPTGGGTNYGGIGQVGVVHDTLTVNNEVTINPGNDNKTVVGLGEVVAVNNVVHKDTVENK